jgi:sulfite oxidase
MTAFGKRDSMIVHGREPFNAEAPRDALAAADITPADAFYVRNHGPVPEIDPAAWRLRIGGLVARELELTLAELRDGRFRERDLVVTLQCAGNRRAGMVAVRPIEDEAPWGPGATGTARWTGVSLADVLAAAGPLPGAGHVGFAGADLCEEAEPPQRFGGSVPLTKALGDEVLLAWAMDGEPLPAVHGAPLRVVVPGWVGARSVKWLERVEVRDEPWDGYYQAVAYRLLPPDGVPAYGAGQPLGELAVVADVLEPEDGDSVAAGEVELRGYAFAGGDRYVTRVDVSADGGASWRQAELLADHGRWAWRHWRIAVELAAGEHELVVRAWDSATAVQPEDPATLWNPKGYMNTAWGRVRVSAE